MHQKNLNRYDAHVILQEFKHDVRKDKWVVIGMILFCTLASFVIFPLACFHLFVMLVGRNSYWIIEHTFTLHILFPYVFTLLFYIYAVNDYITNKRHHYYQKMLIFFVAAAVISIVPFFIGHFFALWATLFFISAMTSLYYLSLAFLQITEENFIPLSNDHLISGRHYPGSYNPFNIDDERTDARLSVALASGGFMLGNIFAVPMIKSCIYLVAIARPQNIIDAAMFLDATFENRMQLSNQPLNIHAKTILLYKNYFMVTPYGLAVTFKTKQLESKAKRLT